MKLSEKEQFNGCHSREKLTVLLFLYRLCRKGSRGMSQGRLNYWTGVTLGTINSSVCKWRKRRLIKRDQGIVGNRSCFIYAIANEGREWVEDVMEKRPDVIADCQKRLESVRQERLSSLKVKDLKSMASLVGMHSVEVKPWQAH